MSRFALAIEPPTLIGQLDVHAYGFGESADLVGVQKKARALWIVYRESPALTYHEAAVNEEFQALAEQWRNDTRFESSLTSLPEHPAYRAIVALGDEVIPVLLHELRNRPDPEFWFVALRDITGVDPVSPEHWGDSRAMAEDWLRWGREHRLVR